MIRSLTLAGIALLSTSALAASRSYTFDPLHSIPHFTVEHLGFAPLHGRFDKMSGKATIDAAARSGNLEVKILASSINTGDASRANGSRSRDDHVKSADFFNVAEFPEIVFRSTRVNFKGEDVESVEGNLTILGVSKPVKLTATSFKCGAHPASKKAMCGGQFETTIKRSDWGMKYGAPVAIGDTVKLMLPFEAAQD